MSNSTTTIDEIIRRLRHGWQRSPAWLRWYAGPGWVGAPFIVLLGISFKCGFDTLFEQLPEIGPAPIAWTVQNFVAGVPLGAKAWALLLLATVIMVAPIRLVPMAWLAPRGGRVTKAGASLVVICAASLAVALMAKHIESFANDVARSLPRQYTFPADERCRNLFINYR
jgi:hypothetical protein